MNLSYAAQESISSMRDKLAARFSYMVTLREVAKAAEAAVEDLPNLQKQLDLATAVAVYKRAKQTYEDSK